MSITPLSIAPIKVDSRTLSPASRVAIASAVQRHEAEVKVMEEEATLVAEKFSKLSARITELRNAIRDMKADLSAMVVA